VWVAEGARTGETVHSPGPPRDAGAWVWVPQAGPDPKAVRSTETTIHNMKTAGVALPQIFSIQENKFRIEEKSAIPLILKEKNCVLYKT
jgi:hypothetical protein